MFTPLYQIYLRSGSLQQVAGLTDTPAIGFVRATLAAVKVDLEDVSPFEATEELGSRQGLVESIVEVLRSPAFHGYRQSRKHVLATEMASANFALRQWVDPGYAFRAFEMLSYTCAVKPADALKIVECLCPQIIPATVIRLTNQADTLDTLSAELYPV